MLATESMVSTSGLGASKVNSSVEEQPSSSVATNTYTPAHTSSTVKVKGATPEAVSNGVVKSVLKNISTSNTPVPPVANAVMVPSQSAEQAMSVVVMSKATPSGQGMSKVCPAVQPLASVMSRS